MIRAHMHSSTAKSKTGAVEKFAGRFVSTRTDSPKVMGVGVTQKPGKSDEDKFWVVHGGRGTTQKHGRSIKNLPTPQVMCGVGVTHSDPMHISNREGRQATKLEHHQH